MPSDTSLVKVCRKCHSEFPLEMFAVTDKRTGLRRAWCKPCESERVRQYYAASAVYREKAKAKSEKWAKANPDRLPAHRRRGMLRFKYGMTEAQYAALLELQGGHCALCSADNPGRVGKDGKWAAGNWHVDHCHKTGKVRGLLCHPCNTQLGGYETLTAKAGEVRLREYLTQPSPVIAQAIVLDPRLTARKAEPPPTYTRSFCSIDGCDKPVKGNGLCLKHYMRVRRGGEAGPAAHLPHAGSLLTDADVLAIRASKDKGLDLAARYNVSQGTISLIRSRKVRPDLP